jgi:hypothetical protein
VAALTAPGGLLLRCPLPPPLVELPLCAPEQEAAVAEQVAEQVWSRLEGPARDAALARYAQALAARRTVGTAVVALAQAVGAAGTTASTLTVRLVASPHDDAEAAAAATVLAAQARGGGGEVQVVGVPLGPAAVRLRRRSLQLTGAEGPVVLDVATLDAVVPLPGRPAAVVLAMFCPTVDDLPRHTGLAGEVLAGTTVVDAGPEEDTGGDGAP